MDFPIHIDTINMELSILYFMGSQVKILNLNMFLSRNTIFILANSADQAEMPHHAAFHLGLHCLPKYLFTSIQNENC